MKQKPKRKLTEVQKLKRTIWRLRKKVRTLQWQLDYKSHSQFG